MIFLFLDVAAAIGIHYVMRNEKGEITGLEYLVLFFWLVFTFWHLITSTNVGHVTSCGVMASWFFSSVTKGQTWASFKRFSFSLSFATVLDWIGLKCAGCV